MSTYPTYFASPRRDSYIAAESRARGEIAWAKDLGMTGLLGVPRPLVLGTNIVIDGASSFALFSPSGERLWEHEKVKPSPITVADGRVFHETRDYELAAVDASGAVVLKDATLAGVTADGEVLVTLLWPREKDLVTALYMPDPKYDEESTGGKPPKPEVSGRRVLHGNSISEWGVDLPGVQTLPPLFVPESNRWIAAQAQVVTFDIDAGKEMSRFALPLEKNVSWSAGADGRLVVAGVHKDHKAVVALDLDGGEKWRWTDAEPDGWVEQPPIHAPKGRVYMLTSRRVLALEKGRLVWDYEMVDEAMRAGARRKGDGLVDKDDKPVVLDRPAWGTALADGALLFVAGNGVRRLDADGKLRFVVRAPAEIVAPPIVDAQGATYVVTATQLISVR